MHGALVRDGAWWWRLMTPRLAEHGLDSVAFELPSCGPGGGLHADADALKALLAGISEEVILVGHSYGGMVIADAGGAANVRRLVFIASFLADAGHALAGFAGGERAPHVELYPDGTMGLIREQLRERFAQDCKDEVYAGAEDRLARQSQLILTQPPRQAAWRHKPSTYVMCAQDRGTPPELQLVHAARATEAVQLDSDHVPFLSHPDQLTSVLVDSSRR